MYSLAAFDLEQAVHLYLKYALALQLRNFPPTHSLEELLKGIAKAYEKEKENSQIIEKNTQMIANLVKTYITSRYLPAEFSAPQIKEMEKFVKKVIKFLKKLWKEI